MWFIIIVIIYSFLKIKGELALAYESYAGGNSNGSYDYYLFYIVLAGSNESFGWISQVSVSGDQH